MADSTFKQFLALTRKNGLSKANRFKVVITPPATVNSKIDLRSVSLLAESSSLPGKTLNVQELKIYGPAHQRVSGVSYGNRTKVTFLLDRNLQVKQLFDEWLDQTVSPSSYNVAYANNYISQEISFYQTDTREADVYTTTLVDAFPCDISEVEQSSSSDGFQRIVVTFAYRSWKYAAANQAPSKPVGLFAPLEEVYDSITGAVTGVVGAILPSSFNISGL